MLNGKFAFKKLYTNYGAGAVTYTAEEYAFLLVIVTSYRGNDYGAGVWIVSCYSSSQPYGNATQIINNNSGGSVTVSGNTVTVGRTGTESVHIYQLL